MLAKPLVINNWSGGWADSPYRGIAGSHARIIGLDISEPGIIQISQKLAVANGGGTDMVKWFACESDSKICGLGDTQHVYRSINSGANWTDITDGSQNTGHGNGAIIFKDYLVVAGDTKLDFYGLLSGSPSWTIAGAGATLNSDNKYHPMLIGKRDGSLYIGAGNIISILSEVAGQTFDPSNAATYTFTATATTLPDQFRIKSLEERGNYLMMGCWEGSNVYDFLTAIIYPWDYVLRTLAHDNPISIRECGLNAQLSIGEILYIWPGVQGNFHYFNGSQLLKLKKVPFDFDSGKYGYVEPAAVFNFKGIPHFGQSDGEIGGTNVIVGIYSFGSLNKNYPAVLNLPHPLSVGVSDAKIGAICGAGIGGKLLLVSWKTGTAGTYGIDMLNGERRYASGSYFETMLYRIGTAKDKEIIDGFEIFLDGPLVTSQALIVKFRRKSSGSWTTVKIGANAKTMAYSEVGGKSEIYVPFQINDVVDLQVRADFETASNNNLTPKLREIRIQ